MDDEASLSYVAFDPSWGYEEMPPVPEIPLFELIRRSSAAHAGKTALVSLDCSVSYIELEGYSDSLACALAGMGVKKGDRVATMLPNCAQHVIAFHGIIKTGAAAVPCNVMMKGEELAYILNDSGPETMICLQAGHGMRGAGAHSPPEKVGGTDRGGTYQRVGYDRDKLRGHYVAAL